MVEKAMAFRAEGRSIVITAIPSRTSTSTSLTGGLESTLSDRCTCLLALHK
jgi:hypothetical protein